MTFLEELTAHKGGLILLKTELYWYNGCGWDRNPGRICLILDAGLTYDGTPIPGTAARTRSPDLVAASYGDAAACLLIDGRPHWVWVAPADVELL
jgi:hypothetical protein